MVLKNKKGMSIIEMMVAIAIFSIGIGGFSMLFARSWRINSFIIEEGESARMASRAVQLVVSDLRKMRQADNGDYPIKSGGDFDFTVYLDDDGDGMTERVHYFKSGSSLLKGVTKPEAGIPPIYPSGDQTVTTLVNYLVNESDQPIFYYYNRDYPGDTVNNPLNTSSLAVDQVKLVRVHLWVNIKPSTAPDNVNFESFVNLRNLNENL